MKDPAFLFYPSDWTLGTMHMTLTEKGAYIELLMLQFARGKFTLAHAKHMLNGSFDLVWATVKEKFKSDGEYYWNERLEYEKQKRAQFTESRRDNGTKRGKKIDKTDEHMHEHMLMHMGNRNRNRNIDNIKEPKSKKFIPPTMPEVIEYFKEFGYSSDAAKKAFNYYQAGEWKGSDGKQVRNWKQKMIAVWFKPEYYVNGNAPETKKDKTPIAL